MNWIRALFEEYRFIRRSGMLACMGINIAIVAVVLSGWLDGNTMDENIRMVLLGAFGLNSVYITLYQWDASRRP